MQCTKGNERRAKAPVASFFLLAFSGAPLTPSLCSLLALHPAWSTAHTTGLLYHAGVGALFALGHGRDGRGIVWYNIPPTTHYRLHLERYRYSYNKSYG
jgi:hypothetical protein